MMTTDLPHRICYECVHCDFITGLRGWSEYTPACPAQIYCNRWHWSHTIGWVTDDDNDAYELSEPSFDNLASNILKAETCPDFKAAPWAREMQEKNNVSL